MNVGDESKPSIKRPTVAFSEGLTGPRSLKIPWSANQSRAALNSPLATSWSSIDSKKPKNPRRSS